MWALACMAQSLPANNSTHALRVLLVTCLVYVECVHGAYIQLVGISGLQLAACTLPSSCWLIILSRPPALEEGVVGGTLVAHVACFTGRRHQCCESPAAFGCVVVMCVVGRGGVMEKEKAVDDFSYQETKEKEKEREKEQVILLKMKVIGQMTNGKDMRMKIGMKAIGPMKMRQHGNPKAGMNGKSMMNTDIFKEKERKERKEKERKERSWTFRSRKRTR